MFDRDKIFALLRPFDIFGLVPLMTFARAPKVYSRLSLILSVTTLAAVFFITIYLGLRLFQRKNPAFFQYSLPSQGFASIKFGPETFPIKLMPDLGTLVMGPHYFLDAYAIAYGPAPPPQIWPFIPYPCSDPKYPNAICFDQAVGVGDSFISNTGPDEFDVWIVSCLTPGVGACPTQAASNPQMAKAFVNIVYQNQLVDPYDFENPIKAREMVLYEALQAGIQKRMNFYLQEIEVQTDDGWLFEDIRTQSALSVYQIQTYSSDVTDPRRAAVQVRYTGDKVIYTRTYPKIQDLLAEMSGIIALIIPVVAILAFPYAEMKMREHMINELYEVKLPRKGPKKGSQAKAKNQTIQMQNLKAKPETRTSQISPVTNHQLIFPVTTHQLTFPVTATGSGALSLDNTIAPINKNESVMASPINSPKESDYFNKGKFNNKRPRVVSKQLELATPFEDDSPGKPLKEKDEGTLNQVVEDVELKDEKMEEVIEVGEKSAMLNQARHTDKLNLTFAQFAMSYFKPMAEVEIIKKVEDDLADALDLASLAKRSADLDKLKAILFTPEERAIFDNLPTSVVTVNDEDEKKMVVSNYRWETSLRGNVKRVNQAYEKLKGADKKTELQRKLLGFYESQYLEDYLREIHPDQFEEAK